TVLRDPPDPGEADLVLVLGPAGSPEARRLLENATPPARLVDAPERIELGWLPGVRTVVLTTTGSTPPSLVDTAENALRGLGPVTSGTRRTAGETISEDAQP
ncbi:hypothetical protein OUY22_33745, partial [Nonomuraea sp. MCN248]|nr:hypothetical protein [Nonomuraea corallina]